jgi:putative tricarboxylic transport membrane protein
VSERESPVAPDEIATSPDDGKRDRGALIVELLVAAVVLALGILILVETREIRVMRSYANVGPRVLPTVVGYGLVVVSLWFAVEAIRTGEARPSTEAEDVDVTLPTDWRAVILIAAGLIAYLALLERAGYVIASAVLFYLAAFGMGSRRLARDLASAIGLSLVTWFVFTAGLSLRLPAGCLDGIL